MSQTIEQAYEGWPEALKKHLPGKHDQQSHGRQQADKGGGSGSTSEDWDEARMLAERVVRDGGFTYQPTTDLSPTSGYAIALYPEKEQILDSIDDATPLAMYRYARDHRESFDSDHRIHFGEWYNKKTDDNPNGDGKVYLDMSLVIDDREEAIKLAKEHGQLGIFNLGSFETIETMTPDERAAWENERKSKAYTRNPRYYPRRQPAGGNPDVQGDCGAGANGGRNGRVRSGSRGGCKEVRRLSDGQETDGWPEPLASLRSRETAQRKHKGPGPHESGSEQGVHGKGGSGSKLADAAKKILGKNAPKGTGEKIEPSEGKKDGVFDPPAKGGKDRLAKWKDLDAVNGMKWEEFIEGNLTSRFSAGDKSYNASITATKTGDADGMFYMFADSKGNTKLTGESRGSARDVMKGAVSNAASVIKNYQPDYVHFTADENEPSRVSLYNFLSKRADRLFNGYVGAKVENFGSGGQHFMLVNEDSLDSVAKGVEKKGGSIDFFMSDDPIKKADASQQLDPWWEDPSFWNEIEESLVGRSSKGQSKSIAMTTFDADAGGALVVPDRSLSRKRGVNVGQCGSLKDGERAVIETLDRIDELESLIHEQTKSIEHPSVVGLVVSMIDRIAGLRAALWGLLIDQYPESQQKHLGPHDHPSGSSQSVHGHSGGKRNRKLPRAESVGPITSGTDLTKYSDEEIAFIYEQAKKDPLLDESGKESYQFSDGMDRLRDEVIRRGISGETESIAGELNLSGNDRDVAPFERSKFVRNFEESEVNDLKEIMEEHRADLNEVRTKYRQWRRGEIELSDKEKAKLTNDMHKGEMTLRNFRQSYTESLEAVASGAAYRIDQTLEDTSELEGFEKVEAIKRNLQAYEDFNLSLHASETSDDLQEAIQRKVIDQIRFTEGELSAAKRSNQREQFFEFDTGERGEAEAEAGRVKFFEEKVSGIEDRLVDHTEEYSQAYDAHEAAHNAYVASSGESDSVQLERQHELEDAYRAKLNAQEQMQETRSSLAVARERLGSVGDPVTRPLSGDDRKKIADLLTPETSSAYVSFDGGAMDGWYDVDYYDQQRIRDDYREMIEDDESLYDDERSQYLDYVMDDESYTRQWVEEVADDKEIDPDEAWDSFISNSGVIYDKVYERGEQHADSYMDESWPGFVDQMMEDVDGDDLFNYGSSHGFFDTSDRAEQLAGEFGLDETDIASLVGAPDDADVTVTLMDSDTLNVEITHPNIERQNRHIGRGADGNLELYHDNFFAADDAPEGFGREVLQKAISNAKEKGVARIKTYAARGGSMVGYYVWPRFGFSYPVRELSHTTQNMIREEFGDDVTDVQDIMKTKAGRAWWKENGVGLNGAVFDLDEGSRSLDVFGRYLLDKEKKKGT